MSCEWLVFVVPSYLIRGRVFVRMGCKDLIDLRNPSETNPSISLVAGQKGRRKSARHRYAEDTQDWAPDYIVCQAVPKEWFCGCQNSEQYCS
jgi:hypothetical protein